MGSDGLSANGLMGPDSWADPLRAGAELAWGGGLGDGAGEGQLHLLLSHHHCASLSLSILMQNKTRTGGMVP